MQKEDNSRGSGANGKFSLLPLLSSLPQTTSPPTLSFAIKMKPFSD